MKTFSFLTILICLSLSTGVMGKSIAKVKKQKPVTAKWQKLLNMIEEEERTIKTLGRLGPRLQYRIIELHSEKIKLLKEKENLAFLRSSSKSRKKHKKEWYFRESRSLYKKTMKDGLRIIKRWPRFKQVANIYYTLALNSRDYGKEKYTEKYLKLSLKNARRYAPIVHLAKTSLAEFYYNSKKYKKAIRYYKQVLSNRGDEWYSKHQYNVGWCYLKVRNFDAAIDSLKEAFRASSTGRFISVKDQVLQSIGTFFVMGKRAEEGAQFYIDFVDKPGKYLIKMAKKTAENGTFKQVRFLLKKALENAIAKGQVNEQIDINLNELEFYRNFKQSELYFKTAKNLVTLNKTNKFNKEQKGEAVTKIKSLVGYLQVKLSKNKRIDNFDYEPKKLKRVIDYFEILASLDVEKTYEYRFFQGETYFSVGEYKSAFLSYRRGLEYSKDLTNKDPKANKKELDKWQRKMANSMLATIEEGSFKKETQYKFTIYTYENHIKLWPIDKVSRVIYKKLFNLYLSNKKLVKTNSTLEKYMKSYKKDQKIQRGMFTQVMDFHIKKNDAEVLANYVNKLEDGFLNFDKAYVHSATSILGKLLFGKYQKIEAGGNKEEAINGYISLYENPKYPARVKAKAAVNASTLQLVVGNNSKAWDWMKIGLKLHNEKEGFELKDKVYALSDSFLVQQNFKLATTASTFFLNKFCHKKYKLKKSFFQNAHNFSLLEKDDEKAWALIKTAKKCKVSPKTIQIAKNSMLGQYTNRRDVKRLFWFYKKTKNDPKFKSKFVSIFLDIYWDSRLHKKSSTQKKISSFMKKLKVSPKMKERIKLIQNYELFEKKISKMSLSNFSDLDKFDENIFNKEFEMSLANMKKVTSLSRPFIKSGHPQIVLGTYSLLKEKYSEYKNSILAYTPNGVPNDFVKGFKGQMKMFTKNLDKEIAGFERQARNLMRRNQIISEYNYNFLRGSKVVSKIDAAYPANGLVVPVDSEGGFK